MNPYEHLPFFVYGTLRPGQYNHRTVDGLVERTEDASVEGFQMFSNGSFPYLVNTGKSDTVKGTLIHVSKENLARAFRNMDALEGCHTPLVDKPGNHYNRFARTVRTDHGEQLAWVYVAPSHSAASVTDYCRYVPSGDWLERDARVRY